MTDFRLNEGFEFTITMSVGSAEDRARIIRMLNDFWDVPLKMSNVSRGKESIEITLGTLPPKDRTL